LNTSDVIAAAALIIAFVSFVLTVVERNRTQQDAIIKALQGEKESVAYIALQISKREGFWQGKEDDIIDSLVLAWVYERSDRSRAILLAALKKLKENKQTNVEDSVKRITELLFNYEELVLAPKNLQEDIKRHKERLDDLNNALKLNQAPIRETSA
jgi:hypothetical protein